MVYGSAVEDCLTDIDIGMEETVQDFDITKYYSHAKSEKPFKKYRIVFNGEKARQIPITIFMHAKKEPKKELIFTIKNLKHGGKPSTLKKTNRKYPSFLKEKWKILIVIDNKVHVH